MAPSKNINGVHRVVTLDVPGRARTRVLCLIQKDGKGDDAYYALAECEAKALRWRSMIKDNAIRRLRDELIENIIVEEDVDSLDVETIFFCTVEASKHL